jgi:N-acetyl-alpha-D-glucosaminyl L-malate synthase BshA
MGGSRVMATELGKLLAEKGHQVHFFGHHLPFRLDKFSSNIFFHKARIIDYPVLKCPLYDLALANKIAQVAKTEQLNLIHVHYAMPHAIRAFLAKQIVDDHWKIITTLHGTDITTLGRDETLKDLLHVAINKIDAITAVSKDLIRETRTLFDSMQDVGLTYNFVDERLYYSRNGDQLRTELAIGKDQVLLHVSNFRSVKRVMDVVDIFFLVNQKIPSTRLVLVGERSDMSKLQTRLHELKLDTLVHFL